MAGRGDQTYERSPGLPAAFRPAEGSGVALLFPSGQLRLEWCPTLGPRHSSQVDPSPQLSRQSCPRVPAAPDFRAPLCSLTAATHSIRWLRSSSVRSRAPPVRSAWSGAFSQSLSAASDGDSNTSSGYVDSSS